MIKKYTLSNLDRGVNAKTYDEFKKNFRDEIKFDDLSQKAYDKRVMYWTILNINNVVTMLKEDYLNNRFLKDNLIMRGDGRNIKGAEKEIKRRGKYGKYKLEEIIK